MHIEDVLCSMRNGEIQSEAAIHFFVAGVTNGTISRPQAAAWLAWAFARGLSDPETLALTTSMTRSGSVMQWEPGPTLIDKHSTGGVGDKVSLPLAPLWAALGFRVPMVSGRGLGHTGGTLDKLESIPGYRTDLDGDELAEVLRTVGCFISGQTGDLAPADRVLYALRNETQTVASIPLIVGSILSKKIAEGVERLVLDVKVGSGAFMTRAEDAQNLARALVSVATGAGVDCSASITAMERPLGRAVGNALEVRESIACLRGEGPDDLRALVVHLARDPRAADVLSSGAALERFARMIEAQGGDPRVVDRPEELLGDGVREHVIVAEESGVMRKLDAFGVGRAAFVLGAGRSKASDPVDFGVGLLLETKPGDSVTRGQPLVRVLHRDRGLSDALGMLHEAIEIGEEVSVPALIQDTIRLG